MPQTSTTPLSRAADRSRFYFPRLSERRERLTDLGRKSLSKLNPRPLFASTNRPKKPDLSLTEKFNRVMASMEVESTAIPSSNSEPETKVPTRPPVKLSKTLQFPLLRPRNKVEVASQKKKIGKAVTLRESQSVINEYTPDDNKIHTDEESSFITTASKDRQIGFTSTENKSSILDASRSDHGGEYKSKSVKISTVDELYERSSAINGTGNNPVNKSKVKEDTETTALERQKEMRNYLKQKIRRWKAEEDLKLKKNNENNKKIRDNEILISGIEDTLEKLSLKKVELREKLEELRIATQRSINVRSFDV